MDKTTPTAEFRIPVDLLKAYTNEVRFVPQIPHNNGYIIFDIGFRGRDFGDVPPLQRPA